MQRRPYIPFAAKKNCADGLNPFGDLINVNDTLYGTTYAGGNYGWGTVFSVDPSTGKEAVLHSFQADGLDGVLPEGGLIAVGGTLYGTTYEGGSKGKDKCGGLNCGTVFSLDPISLQEKVLHSFGARKDGIYPTDVLIDVAGLLYGVTGEGGTGKCPNGCGTVFSLDPAMNTETVLHSFNDNGRDGFYPQARLLKVRGRLYGTTTWGGTGSYGTIFSFDLKRGKEKVVHSFQNNSNDGAEPIAGLIDVGGILYGTTQSGGSGHGTVYSLDTQTGTETTLYSFAGGTDGDDPSGDLRAVRGTLYGTTWSGGGTGCGGFGCGTVFRLKP